MKRIALIGAGSIADAHAHGYEANPDRLEVAVICDTHPERLGRLAKRFPHAKRVTDWREAMGADVDAVDICLPHHLHQSALLDACAAGKHILCEKPLCMTWEEAEQIATAVERSGVTLMCAHNQLFDPAVQKAKQMAEDGLIGRLWAVRTADCFAIDSRGTEEDWGWRGKLATMGGGCLIDTGYHPSYLLLYFAGGAPTEVTAMIDHHSANPLEGEDTAEVLVRFADGVRGTVLTSWAYNVPVGHWQFHLIGERGEIYGRGSTLYLRPTGWSEPAKTQLPDQFAFDAQAAHFADCLENGTRPINNQEDGIAVLKIILGAYQSAAEKRTVVF